jgi:glutathione-regulated potassium-efflux system ancillary protein KefC
MTDIFAHAALWLGLALLATLLSIWLGIAMAMSEIVLVRWLSCCSVR